MRLLNNYKISVCFSLAVKRHAECICSFLSNLHGYSYIDSSVALLSHIHIPVCIMYPL